MWGVGVFYPKTVFMRNIKLTIEYQGTNYSGWQRQKNGLGIQEVIEDAIFSVAGERVVLLGSGRTDAGVHALGQVANFKTKTPIPASKLARALNAVLPPDIVIIKAEDVPLEFHAQYHSRTKVYLYRILNRDYPSAILRPFVWWVRDTLDITRMHEALPFLVGRHDFKVLAHADAAVKNTVREVIRVHLEQKGDILEFEIEANGFLKRMVRLIVGTLVNVGRKKASSEEFSLLLSTGKKEKFVFSAPPEGLFLKEVKYDD